MCELCMFSQIQSHADMDLFLKLACHYSNYQYINTVSTYILNKIVYFSLYGYIYAKQKHLGCKKGEANQKQQLSDYGCIRTLLYLRLKTLISG